MGTKHTKQQTSSKLYPVYNRWKANVNNRVTAQDREDDVALTPSTYCPLVLREKLENVLEWEISWTEGRCNDTSIFMSVNDLF
jgi:hypothetical protein